MKTKAKVSVIIPTYNRAHYICEAIDSALAQTYPDVEIVVVDDGSTDGTRAVLKGYGDKIRYYYQENQGVSAALNFGIEKSSGQYLAILDDDDIWFPEKLEVQVAHLEAHPEVGMVHADMLILDERSDDSVPKKRTLSRPIPSGYILPELIVKNVIAYPTVVVRRSCLDEVGLFDPELRSSEDYHLWLRIARRFPITYLDQPLAIYRLHSTNLTRNRLDEQRWHLKALEKMLRLNPGVVDEVGRDVIHFAIAFKTAYMYFDQGSHKEARRYFVEARRFRSLHLPTYGYYLACCLPPAWIKGLRQLNRGYANRRSRSYQR
jgi:glycosyltransferase involved in cell wall biosynthesis